MGDIPAKAVGVVRSWQAICTLCPWASEPYGSYQTANEQRFAHLDEHRRKAAEQAASGPGRGQRDG